MILFNKLSVKNFGSFGNSPTIVDLNIGMALVQGRNGTGKSTIVTDALTFVLYGKSFKKINLPQLINNINGSNLLVELDFIDRGTGSSFKIIRGMKPGIFEIYKDGILIPQEASTKDYQSILERDILKISYRAFTQILVMGSAQYTPFMQLPPGQRRLFIDEILNTKIIATMSSLVGDRISSSDKELDSLETKISAFKSETANKKQILDSMIINSKERISSIEKERSEYLKEKHDSDITLVDLNAKYNSLLDNHNKKFSDIYDYSSELRALKDKIQRIHKEESNARETESCSHCHQCISEDHKTKIILELVSFRNKLETELVDLENKHEMMMEMKTLELESKSVLESLKSRIVEVKNKSFQLGVKSDSLQSEIDRLKVHSEDDADILRENIRQTAEKALETIKDKDRITLYKSHLVASKAILSDSGVKSKIIGTYIPMINKEVNEILSEMDMFVTFQLDDNFNETILHRGREDMSYSSLSEGEKRRVDLALLSAFRRIVMMKESGGVNLLVLDEMDSGLDFDGRAKFLELVRKMSPNSWVISHAIRGSGLEAEFDKVIAVNKVGDFTVIKEE